MPLSIRVAPRGEEWIVQASVLAKDLVFLSGGSAEAAARALADVSVRGGQAAELCIYLRDGSLAGAFHYPVSAAGASAQGVPELC
jgi:hypothetical protein